MITIDPQLLRQLNSGQSVTFTPATCQALHRALTEYLATATQLSEARDRIAELEAVERAALAIVNSTTDQQTEDAVDALCDVFNDRQAINR